MPIDWLILGGLALYRALQEKSDETPAAGLEAKYFDDGVGLALTVTGCPAHDEAILVLHGRSEDGGFLKAGHEVFADKDGDFCIGKPIVDKQCEFYIPHGAILGAAGSQSLVSFKAFLPKPGGSAQLLTEDLMRLDFVDKRFSVIDYSRPLLEMARAVATADGPLDRTEVRFILRFVADEMKASDADFDAAGLLLKERASRHSSELAAEIRRRFTTVDCDFIASFLANVATCDGQAKPSEIQLIKEMMLSLGMDQEPLKRFIETLGVCESEKVEQCLALLGLTGRPSEAVLRNAWRRAMKDFHPDKYHASQLPEAVRAMIAQKGAEINAAYDTLQREYGYGVT